MIHKYLESLFFNIKQKSSNPFLGTLIIVWIFRNWDLVYALFYFDEIINFSSRINWINSYYSEKNFYWDLLWTVLESFVMLAITYGLLNASRYIINLYEKQLTPWIYKITDKSSIVLKSDFLKLDAQINVLETKISEERQKRLGAESEVERLEKLLSTPKEKSKDEDLNGILVNGKESQKSDENIDALYKKIKESEHFKGIEYVFESISTGDSVSIDLPSIRYFATLGLLEKNDKKTGGTGFGYYYFTPLGLKIKDKFVTEDYK